MMVLETPTGYRMLLLVSPSARRSTGTVSRMSATPAHQWYAKALDFLTRRSPLAVSSEIPAVANTAHICEIRCFVYSVV